MDNNTMKYKDYTALIEFSDEDGCFIGSVIGINDIVSFDGETVDEIRKNFHDMIEHYIAACADEGRKPNTPISEVMVPIPPVLYAKIAQKAEYDGVPINTVMETALQKFVQHA
ncbi:MAG: type II toxin-antitoxin system HicB family antitoxin [Deltaproteobacteria bacterium]|jgi:predicted HicB family RNase H-like nuclease|nr:type II toxin-antitoxin system HicB family antitoxin [Deltaproteobacteria bacterium]